MIFASEEQSAQLLSTIQEGEIKQVRTRAREHSMNAGERTSCSLVEDELAEFEVQGLQETYRSFSRNLWEYSTVYPL